METHPVQCDWIPRPSRGQWPSFQCSRCRYVVEVRSDEPVEIALSRLPPCGELLEKAVAHSTPSALSKAAHYGNAILKWIKAGRPVREWTRVEEIFTTHCQPCPRFVPWADGKKGGCAICGCNLSPDGAAYKNKLRMATEACPETPPRFTEDA